jgi:hypothetical protein
LKQLSSRIAESDRTQLTGTAIADSLYGLQGDDDDDDTEYGSDYDDDDDGGGG